VIDMNILPLKNKVLVERLENINTTSSGIILSSSQEPDRAKILAVGPDADGVSVGDVVLLDWNAAMPIDNKYVVPSTSIVLIYGE
jgi:co-chaperonin GroES (HSP10)